MERKIPKNVRQIGNVSDSLKIYVEDYVDTYLNQLCEKEADGPVGAVLIGETVKEDGLEYQYIYGAVQMKTLLRDGDGVDVTEEIWNDCCEVCKAFFDEGEIIGWCAVIPGIPLAMNMNLKKMHQKLFSKTTGIFILKDPVCREELYFAPKFNDLMLMNGHYIYYEKNPAMQNYMISSRKKIGVTPSEVVADRAAKSFRNLVQTKMVMQEKPKIRKLACGAGAILAFVLLITGISVFNNYDRMKAIQMTIEAMSDTVKAEDVKEVAEKEKIGDELKAEVDNKKGKEEKKTDKKEDEAGEKEIYIVQAGDTLAGISKKAYGDYEHIDAIGKANDLENGNLIYVGQKLVLP